MSLEPTQKQKLAVIAAGILAGSVLVGFQTSRSSAEIERLTSELGKTHVQIRAAREKAMAKDSAGLNPDMARGQVMNKLTNQIAKAARNSGVTLSQLQFDGSPTKLPSSSDSKDPAKTGGWSQNVVSFAVNGPTPQVFLVIKQLAELKEPYEFKEIGINRMVNAGSGEQGVTANVKMSILVPSEGAS